MLRQDRLRQGMYGFSQASGRIPRQGLKLWLLGVLSTGLFIAIILSMFVTLVAFVIVARDLPSPTKLTNRQVVQATKIFDRNGQLLYDVYGDQNRTVVPITELPKYLLQATVAIEDKDFYKHKGFDPLGILRAVRDIVFKRQLAGGSTITQQAVKNTLLSSERTLTRKVKEFVLAVQVENRYSKDEILQIYLNEVPYGGTAWGVETAAQTYFGKRAKDLTLVEAVILAGLPQQPTVYSPFGSNPKAYIARATEVLRRMREEGYLSSEQEEKTRNELPKVKFAPQGGTIKAPHFVLWVKEQLVQQFGEKMVEQGGLQVTTSLDYSLQEQAQKIVTDEIDKLKSAKVGNGAAVVLNPKTGEILAMVGSKDYFAKDYDGNVNVALSYRQPGSATKPITYATAFKKGYSPATMLIDQRTDFDNGQDKPKYVPVNYDGKYHGPVQIRYALANSYNIPAVKMLAVIGIKDVMRQAHDMGVTSWEPTGETLANVGLSLTLGGREVRLLDLASAYGVFANQGVRQEPFAILRVTDSAGHLLYENRPTIGQRVLSEEIAFLISSILSDNNSRIAAFGPSSLLVIPNQTVAVKTGTTDEKRDNWTFGYTPSLVVGTWVGNNDNSKMSETIASGITGASPIWNKITRQALKDKKNEPFAKPAGVVQIEVDTLSGLLPGPFTESRRSEYFISGTQPSREDDIHQKVDDKIVLNLTDPYTKMFCTGASCQVTMASGQTAPGGPQVSIENVPDGANVPLEFDVLAKAVSGKQIINVSFYWDDEQVKQLSAEPYVYRVKVAKDKVGAHTLRVDAVDAEGNLGSKLIHVMVKENL